MTDLTEKDVRDALAYVEIPDLDEAITADDTLSSVDIKKTNQGIEARIILDLPPHYTQNEIESMRERIEDALRRLGPNVIPVVLITTHVQAPSMEGSSKNRPKAEARAEPPKAELPDGVKSVIMVASAKGGVGKSTAASNLAVALSHYWGLKVALLDADVQTPSVPRLMGLRGEIEQNEEGMVIPKEAHGIAAMSMGLVIPEGKAAVWRGPIMHNALHDLIHGVAWGERDVLVLDMPPGTGDVPLSVAHHVPLSGAVMISTPQTLALDDTQRGIEMFQKMKVPLIGMIENMSGFTCPHCAQCTPIFGEGGAEEQAKNLHIPFLGRLPFDQSLVTTMGTPLVVRDPNGAHAQIYRKMAEAVRLRLPALLPV